MEFDSVICPMCVGFLTIKKIKHNNYLTCECGYRTLTDIKISDDEEETDELGSIDSDIDD